MIRHMSFGVDDPPRVAKILAELTGGTPVRAPTPPFPEPSWFLLAGDDKGSSLEIIPASACFDPDAPLGVGNVPAKAGYSGTHVLIDSIKSAAEITAVAEREGWRCQQVETGLFRIVKIWIDGCRLVELFAEGDAERYADAFGTSGLATVDDRLRALETGLAEALTSNTPPKMRRPTI